MPRPTAKEAERLKKTMKAHVANGLSINEIARLTGKSQQAVHQYLKAHGLATVEMQRRNRLNLDNDTAQRENG